MWNFIVCSLWWGTQETRLRVFQPHCPQISGSGAPKGNKRMRKKNPITRKDGEVGADLMPHTPLQIMLRPNQAFGQTRAVVCLGWTNRICSEIIPRNTLAPPPYPGKLHLRLCRGAQGNVLFRGRVTKRAVGWHCTTACPVSHRDHCCQSALRTPVGHACTLGRTS